jgi:hypothetical protein
LRPLPHSSVYKGEDQLIENNKTKTEENMTADAKKIEKKEMKNIQAGVKKTGTIQGSNQNGEHPGTTCAFAAGSCCQRTERCTTNSNG